MSLLIIISNCEASEGIVKLSAKKEKDAEEGKILDSF